MSPGRRPFAGQSGFTLLEILVAVTILALALGSVFRLFGSSLRSIENSNGYSRAVVLGEQMMTQILFDEAAFPPEPRSGRFDQNPAYSYTLESSLYEKPIGRTDDEQNMLETYLLRLKVGWMEENKPKSVTLTTLKTVVLKTAP